MACQKRPYYSEKQARLARGRVGFKRRFRSHLRIYRCPVCSWWHLTSEERFDEPL